MKGIAPPTIDEYRALLADAREVVVALRDTAAPDGTRESCRAWFEYWQSETIEEWNHIRVLLDASDPDGVAGLLDIIRTVGRAINERCDWPDIAPRAAAARSTFADHLFEIWPRLPDNGTPEAHQVREFFPTLAAEFQPVEPPDTLARVP